MTAVAATRTWVRCLAASVPSAWHYDPVFRWAAIGAGVALALFALRLTAPPARLGPSSVPGSSMPANLGTAYGAAATGSAPPTDTGDVPKIAPGRSLDGVTIAPAPDLDRFGTVPPASHR